MASADLYRSWQRAQRRAFTTLMSRSFQEWGRRSALQPPVRLLGERRIAVGTGVFIGPHCWLATYESDGQTGRLEIGSGTSIVGHCVLAAASRVALGRSVLLASNVYIADHQHAYFDRSRPILAQGLDRVAPVEIGDGAWLGQNTVVCPGVTIGRGAVIGANSVVKDDVPEYCVAVGSPARVVRRFDGKEPRVVRLAAMSQPRRPG
jgi:lipopolysaccharide O-acetyltransferase